MFLTELSAVAVTGLDCIRKLPVSNLSQVIGYPKAVVSSLWAANPPEPARFFL
jgi:hypothetical protein